jgi:hypothetical protein
MRRKCPVLSSSSRTFSRRPAFRARTKARLRSGFSTPSFRATSARVNSSWSSCRAAVISCSSVTVNCIVLLWSSLSVASGPGCAGSSRLRRAPHGLGRASSRPIPPRVAVSRSRPVLVGFGPCTLARWSLKRSVAYRALASSASRRRGSFTSCARRQSRAADGRERRSPGPSPGSRGGTGRPLAEPRDRPRTGTPPVHAPDGGRPPQGGGCVSRSFGARSRFPRRNGCRWREGIGKAPKDRLTTKDSPSIPAAPLRPLRPNSEDRLSRRRRRAGRHHRWLDSTTSMTDSGCSSR